MARGFWCGEKIAEIGQTIEKKKPCSFESFDSFVCLAPNGYAAAQFLYLYFPGIQLTLTSKANKKKGKSQSTHGLSERSYFVDRLKWLKEEKKKQWLDCSFQVAHMIYSHKEIIHGEQNTFVRKLSNEHWDVYQLSSVLTSNVQHHFGFQTVMLTHTPDCWGFVFVGSHNFLSGCLLEQSDCLRLCLCCTEMS